MRVNVLYEHSGLVPPLGLLTALGVGLLGGSVLAAVYACAILYIPFAGFVSFVLAGGFGVLVGVVTGWGLVRGKVRNTKVAVGLAALVGLLSLYVAWAVWTFALLRSSDVEAQLLPILASPQLLWELMKEIAEVGAWSMSDFTPTGWVLWILWLLEALLVLVPAMALGAAPMGTPFCERCDVWTEERKDVARVAAADPEALGTQLGEKNLGVLRELGPVPASAAQWSRLDLHTCPQCQGLNTLTVEQVSLTTNDKGEVSEETNTIVGGLLLYSADLALIQELQEGPAGALDSPEPAG